MNNPHPYPAGVVDKVESKLDITISDAKLDITSDAHIKLDASNKCKPSQRTVAISRLR